jgi:predicted anti-sigma-YlaC factor YlaD
MPDPMDEREIICREFVEVVTDYLEAALPAETTDLVEQHLVMCDWCRDYLGQLEATVGAVGEVEPEPPPREMLESLLVAFRRQSWEDT